MNVHPSISFIEGLGAPELMLIFFVVLLLFGGQKLPEFARGLGKTMREFRKAASGVEQEFKRAIEEKPAALPPPSMPAPPPPRTQAQNEQPIAPTPENSPNP